MHYLLILFFALGIESAQSAEKQRSFNDQNYQPKEIHNSIPAPKKSTAVFPKKNKKPHIKMHRAPWRWNEGSEHFPDIQKGRFSYRVVNGLIEGASVCANETYGSLRYRACRKGAAAYFKARCKKGETQACTGMYLH